MLQLARFTMSGIPGRSYSTSGEPSAGEYE